MYGIGLVVRKEDVLKNHSVQDENNINGKCAEGFLSVGLGLGWNLGNTLDALGGETAWGQPAVTYELIEAVKKLGFDTIRIPVSWGQYTSGAPDYVISRRFLERVERVVGWAGDMGLNVIINLHHDNDFYYPTKQNAENAAGFIRAVWSQVAERFEECGEWLIFESMNEPRLAGTAQEWVFDSGLAQCAEAQSVINLCNQAFVDTIRGMRGYNKSRLLLLPAYAAKAKADGFVMPEDLAGRTLASIHAYMPHMLCMDGSLENSEYIDSAYDEEISVLLDTCTGSVITETGCTNKNNPHARHRWAEKFVGEARKRGISCVMWDNGEVGAGSENFGIIDRARLCVYPESRDYYIGMLDGLKA